MPLLWTVGYSLWQNLQIRADKCEHMHSRWSLIHLRTVVKPWTHVDRSQSLWTLETGCYLPTPMCCTCVSHYLHPLTLRFLHHIASFSSVVICSPQCQVLTLEQLNYKSFKRHWLKGKSRRAPLPGRLQEAASQRYLSTVSFLQHWASHLQYLLGLVRLISVYHDIYCRRSVMM